MPHCPKWDTAELVRHMGGILAWMAAIVTSRQRVSRPTLPPPPADPGELPAWYLARLDEAKRIEDVDLHDFKLHPLKGDQRGFWSLTVTGNWRLIFSHDEQADTASDIDLIDYH